MPKPSRTMRVILSLTWRLLSPPILLMLTACGSWYWHESDVRQKPDQTRSKLSVGDTREKVRGLLGLPRVDAPELGLEVYRLEGRDWGVGWVFLPWIPMPVIGDKLTYVVLIVYDQSDRVQDILPKMAEGPLEDKSFLLPGSNYVLANSSPREMPDTLLSPEASFQEVSELPSPQGQCDLFLIMENCPAELLKLDDEIVADLPEVASSCRFGPLTLGQVFLRKRISPGPHRLTVHQSSWRRGDFAASFECAPEEKVFAILDTRLEPDWWSAHFEGRLAIRHDLPARPVGSRGLRQILWHKGSWYGPTDAPIHYRK